MNKKILFVVAQAGQAAYFLPLWRRWHQDGNVNWRVLAHQHAQNVIEKKDSEIQKYYIGSWGDDFQSTLSAQDYTPDVIVSSVCGRAQEIDASIYAQTEKIKHIQVIDSWYQYAERIRRSNQDGMMPDVITVIDEWARDIAIDQKLPADRVVCAGHPAWEKSVQCGLTKGKKNHVLFASQPLSEIPEMRHLGYNEHDVWNHLLAFRSEYPELIEELVYHPHPSQIHRPKFSLDYARLSMPGEKPIQTCGTMVSMFSAIMVEGYLAGQNVIGLQPDLKTDNICPLQKRKCIEHITSYDFDALASALQKPKLNEHRNKLNSFLAGSTDRLEQIILK